MDSIKNQILNKICYTEAVYDRINRKIGTNFSKKEIEDFTLKVLNETKEENIVKKGKNYYVNNIERNIRITISSFTFRAITMDKISP
ncbi:MAG TPA: DUF3781 domain-containing protein [Spirochaetota bacterium]|nr:DUF3781 domain-containing protein [Spirochaetota bacterium]